MKLNCVQNRYSKLAPVTDAATSFLFGESLDSQVAYISAKNAEFSGIKNASAAQEATSAKFLDAFETASDYTIYRLRLRSLYWLADGFKFRLAAKILHDFTNRLVQRAFRLAISALQRRAKNLHWTAILADRNKLLDG